MFAPPAVLEVADVQALSRSGVVAADDPLQLGHVHVPHCRDLEDGRFLLLHCLLLPFGLQPFPAASLPTLGDGFTPDSRERPFRVLSGFLGAGFSRGAPFRRGPACAFQPSLAPSPAPCAVPSTLRCSLCLPHSSRCRRVPGGLSVRLPLRHRSSATFSNAFLRGGRLPGADVDPFDNVYFPPRVSTHARLPLRILPRVLRRFARPRSTARNPRKGASRL